jgi:hypothetical protein
MSQYVNCGGLLCKGQLRAGKPSGSVRSFDVISCRASRNQTPALKERVLVALLQDTHPIDGAYPLMVEARRLTAANNECLPES